ncbi:Rha family transcriptional regulator [Lactobacillus acetotolerans]|uniref:Rha family transcriptional regulator n=1 Tax=Lactobacillus acetotolerans TaxID=1600 RepID=UPI002FD8A946
MNDLVIMKNKQAVTSSLQVADTFEKEHKNIMRDIDKLLEFGGSKLSREMFATGTYENRGKQYPMYYMNRDGFTLLAMGFTGTKALEFKLKYIEAFNAMEETLIGLPMEKIDPVKQAEIEMTKAKTHQANALYRIAMKTESHSSQQSILARAAESITGEMTIPIMKDKEFSAGQVGEQLGISANMVGRIANRIGLKAEQPGQNEYGRWSNSKSQHSDKEVAQWLYTEAGLKLIDTNR